MAGLAVERRPQRRQLLEGDVGAQIVVAFKTGERHDQIVVETRVIGGGGLLVGFVCEQILRLAWNLPLFDHQFARSEEHTSELQSLMRISYAVFCLKKKTQKINYSIETTKQRSYLST